MFDIGRDDMRAGGVKTADEEVEGFGAAGSKNQLLGFDMESMGDGIAGMGEKLFRLLAKRMDAGGVERDGSENLLHRFDHAWVKSCSRVVVEIDFFHNIIFKIKMVMLSVPPAFFAASISSM